MYTLETDHWKNIKTLLNIARQPTWEKWLTSHKKEESEKTFLKQCESEKKSSSCTKYIVTSVTRLEKTTKKDNQKTHVCILLHREALSVIRCILLQAYSHWYLLQSGEREREKSSTLSSKWQFFVSCTFVTLLVVQKKKKKKVLCHWSRRKKKKKRFQDSLKMGE